MGKPTGYLEYQRRPSPCRPPQARLGDWREFCLPMPDQELREQAARCMDCGVPFCHGGVVFGGAPAGCPLHNLIRWNDMVYRGFWRGLPALDNHERFSEFLAGSVPPYVRFLHRRAIWQAVTIQAIERVPVNGLLPPAGYGVSPQCTARASGWR